MTYRIPSALVAALAVLLGSPAWTQSPKIAVIHGNQLGTLKALARVQQTLQQEFRADVDHMASLQSDLADGPLDIARLKERRASEAAIAAKQQELKAMSAELDRLTHDVEARGMARRQELSEPVLARAREALQRFLVGKGYQQVVDLDARGAVAPDGAVDETEALRAWYDAQTP